MRVEPLAEAARMLPNQDPAPGAMASVPAPRMRTQCAICGVREACLACDLLPAPARAEFTGCGSRRVARGKHVYRAGDAFSALFTVRSGSCKTCLPLPDGREQVTGFQLSGDLLGLEAIGAGVHRCNAIALEDSRVCVIEFAGLEAAALPLPELQRHLHKAMSLEIAREHALMLVLGTMDAEERLASFLLGLSQRYADRGLPATPLHLHMKREEIGSHLGMKVETVSRALSRLRDEGLVRPELRRLHLLDLAALSARVGARG
jgi:CRP/FNR family transcriptional regulator